MRRTNTSGMGFAFVAAVALLGILGAGSMRADMAADDMRESSANRLKVIGLTDTGRLISFRSKSPGSTRDIGAVTGLTGSDTSLVGIDFRVQDGKLYGVGNGGGVYTIDATTAAAQFVNALTVPLNGTFFGVDFNPAADRLRIISDMGQNLAHNVNTGGVTLENDSLTYNATITPRPVALGVSGAAYTNNDLPPAGSATGTTLFDLDTAMDQIVVQSPPGNGTLGATGKLGFDAGPSAGFDIYSDVVRGVTSANRGFAVFAVNGKSFLYRISLLTGRASRIGALGEPVVDIALPLNQ